MVRIKWFGIGFLNLIDRPILDFEDGQAGVSAKWVMSSGIIMAMVHSPKISK
jgi:hypothetical protein